MVAYEHLHQFVVCLAVDGYWFAAMRHGVDERLLRGIQQCIGLRTRQCVSHRHHLNRLTVRILHMSRDFLQPGIDGTVRRSALLIQPFTQFAFLRTRQREHGLLVACVKLNQRQRLQYAVMQMGGHVGALLFAFLQCAFRAQITNQGHNPRHNRQQHADKHRQSGKQQISRGMPHGFHHVHMRGDIDRICGEDKRDAAEHRPQLAFLRIEPQPGNTDADHAEQQRQHQRTRHASGQHDAAYGKCSQSA